MAATLVRYQVASSQFRAFDQYLRFAMSDADLLHSPFSEVQRHTIAYMEWLKMRWAADAEPLFRRSGPRVSIIMSGHRRRDSLSRALGSALSQTYRHFEVIVVDGGSTDDTTRWLDRLGDRRVRPVRHTLTADLASSRRAGIEAASGDLIAYLDRDDWWDPDFLMVMAYRLEQQGAAFGYSAQRILRPSLADGADTGPREVVRFAPFHRSLLENTNYIPMGAVVHTREAMADVGGFDPDNWSDTDWDMLLQLSDAHSPEAVPVVLSASRRSAKWADAHSGAIVELPSVQARLGARSIHSEGLTLSGEVGGEITSALASTFAIARHARNAPVPPTPFDRVRIVIPSYEAADYLRVTLDSLFSFTPPGTFEALVVDNASGAAVQRVLNEFEGNGLVRTIRNPVNLGFTRAVAQGIEAPGHDGDVVLLNNDVLLTPGWLEALVAVAHAYDSVGLVAPRQVVLPNENVIRPHVPGASVTTECDINLSAIHENVLDPFFDARRGIVSVTFAMFFCVLVTRAAIKRCGVPDHRGAPHYRSDRVYCEAIRLHAGLRLLYTPHAKVYHFLGKATRDLQVRDPVLHRGMLRGQIPDRPGFEGMGIGAGGSGVPHQMIVETGENP